MSNGTVLREEPLSESGAVPHLRVPGWTDRFGVVAGITGRGSETPPFDLGLHSAEPVGPVMARWRSFQDSLPSFQGFVLGDQVHAVETRWHETVDGWLRLPGVDGHGTSSRGVMLLVTVADCIPVYLVAPGAGACALLHAGWRGASSGMVERGLALLASQAGVDPSGYCNALWRRCLWRLL